MNEEEHQQRQMARRKEEWPLNYRKLYGIYSVQRVKKKSMDKS